MGNSITIEVTKPVITIEFGTDIVISPGITPITPSSIIQNLGVKNTDYTVDFNNGRFVTVTTGSGAAIITIPDWTYSAESVNTCFVCLNVWRIRKYNNVWVYVLS